MKNAKNKPIKPRSGVKKAVLSTVALIIVFIVSFFVIVGIASPHKLSKTSQINQFYSVVDSYGGKYFGSLIDMSYNGNGEFQYLSGGYYEGEFANSQREGNGTFHWKNGDTYVGTWSGDQMLSGTYTFANGNFYKGEFNNNRFSSGTYYIKDISRFSDIIAFSALYANGKVNAITFVTDNGFTFNGQVNGNAEIKYENGDEYSGSVKDGVRNGSGQYTWVNENGIPTASYDGDWNNGIMSGTGTYHYSSAYYPYVTGTFIEGKPDGTAVYYQTAEYTYETLWENGSCISVAESQGED